MSNPIKYTTGSETLALKKGNFYIGTGDVGKGPSDTTGYYQGPNVPSGGYIIYMNRDGAPGNLSYHTAANDSELIAFTNNLAGQSYTTVNECLVYFAGQTDKVCLNKDYEGIVTDGLVFNVDAGFTSSYPKNGTTWYDVGGTNNGTLTNGPTFSTDGGGSIVFDGANDYVNFGNPSELQITTSAMTMELFFKTPTYANQNNKRYPCLLSKRYGYQSGEGAYQIFIRNVPNLNTDGFIYSIFTTENGNGNSISDISVTTNTWNHYVAVYNGVDVRTYINNVLQSNITPLTGNILNQNYNFYIGVALAFGNINFSEYRYQGEIPIVRLYNRALSASEVLQSYNAQKGRFGL